VTLLASTSHSLTFHDVDEVRHYLNIHGEALLVGFAAATAIVVFIQWALQVRRRPEVAVRWAWDVHGGGGAFDQHPWVPGETLITGPLQLLQFRISLENTGDALSEHSAYNVCVPITFSMSLSGPSISAKLSQGATNRYAGRCWFLAEEFVWLPGDFRLTFFDLTTPPSEGDWEISVDVSSDRFNATGHRWFPSMVKWRNRQGHERAKWPRRHPGIIRRNPRSIAASVGSRSEQRTIVVCKGAQPRTVKTSEVSSVLDQVRSQSAPEDQ
jgi:hypothetical protein